MIPTGPARHKAAGPFLCGLRLADLGRSLRRVVRQSLGGGSLPVLASTVTDPDIVTSHLLYGLLVGGSSGSDAGGAGFTIRYVSSTPGRLVPAAGFSAAPSGPAESRATLRTA